MNTALAALQRLRTSKTSAVAEVLLAAKVPTPPPRPAAAPLVSASAALLRTRSAAPTEARRIGELPTWDYAALMAQAQPGGPLDYTARLRTPTGTMQLKPIQNLALYWIEQKKGLVGPLAVGSGKTLISLLASVVLKAQRPVLFVPPTLQLPLRREIEKLQLHFQLPKNLHIIPYSQLSVAKSTALLEELKPDLIICDEAHMIKNRSAARTKRVTRYFRQFPTTRFVALSGTLTSKGLRDYVHLCELALREGSPLPVDEADLLAWSNCIDSGSQPQERDWSIFAAFSDVRHIVDVPRRQDEARAVFRQRFTTTPGVVATTEASVQCSLNLYSRPLNPPAAVTDALQEAHRTWERPDGETMDSALALWRLGMQLSQGFYLRWVWPNGVVDHEWLNARAEWHRQVRYVPQRNLTGFDSPFLVWQGVSRGRLTSPEIVRAWTAWEGVKHRPTPPTETVWISDFLIRDAVRWHREHPKGLIWHSDLATEEALRATGIPTYGRGEVPPLDGSRGGMALSVRVHGTGLNLQHAHSENLILSFPSSGKTMEQLVGRTHRQGQEEDEVNLFYYQHTADAREAILKARADARYIEETQGSPMKLCYGTWG